MNIQIGAKNSSLPKRITRIRHLDRLYSRVEPISAESCFFDVLQQYIQDLGPWPITMSSSSISCDETTSGGCTWMGMGSDNLSKWTVELPTTWHAGKADKCGSCNLVSTLHNATKVSQHIPYHDLYVGHQPSFRLSDHLPEKGQDFQFSRVLLMAKSNGVSWTPTRTSSIRRLFT
jgi:hypothetical protein